MVTLSGSLSGKCPRLAAPWRRHCSRVIRIDGLKPEQVDFPDVHFRKSIYSDAYISHSVLCTPTSSLYVSLQPYMCPYHRVSPTSKVIYVLLVS